jgi:hypothetical protein
MFCFKNKMFRSKIAGLAVLICFGCSKISTAADWELDGTLGQALQYNDNISLSTQRTAVFGYILAPALQVQRKGQVLDLSLRGQGDIRIYDESRWNCENYGVALSSSYRSSGRSTFKLDGNYNRTCTLVQQLTDTGLLIPKSESENYRVLPSWAWQWTPVDRININASYSKQSYTTATSSNFNGISPLSDNETFGFAVQENHSWSPRLLLSGSVFFANTQFTRGEQRTHQNSFGFQLGGKYKISERWVINVEGGPQWIDSNASRSSDLSERGSSITLGGIGKAELSYKGQIYDVSFNISSSAMPSGFGQLQQYSSAGINYKYKFTKNLLLDARGEFLHSQPIGNDNLGVDRNYLHTSIGLLWEPIRHWMLRGEYNYRWQEYNRERRIEAYSNDIILSLNYEF